MSDHFRNGTLGTATILVAGASFAAALLATPAGFGPASAVLGAVALLALPFVVAGLTEVQRPGLATLGQAGAVAFCAGCVVAAFLCLYALVAGAFTLASLRDQLDGLVSATEAFLIPGGVVFGAATYVRRMLPRWSSACLVLGLLLGAAMIDASDGLRLLAVGLSAFGLAGLGFALLPGRSADRLRTVAPAAVPAHQDQSGRPDPPPLAPRT